MANGVVPSPSEWMDENRGSDLRERESLGTLKLPSFICGRAALVLGVDDGDSAALFHRLDSINRGFVILK